MEIKINEAAPIQAHEISQTKEKPVDSDFSFTLTRLGEDGLRERLNGLIEDITLQGKKLADHMDIKDLKKYRSLISDFIGEVVTNSHKFERDNFLDRRGRHRVYGIVKLINKSVDDLAQELLAKEKDHIRILDKTDEIRGLLLDILI